MESIPIYEDPSVLNQRLENGIAESEAVYQADISIHDIGLDEMEDIWEDSRLYGGYVHPVEDRYKTVISKASRYKFYSRHNESEDISEENTLSHYREMCFGRSTSTSGYKPFSTSGYKPFKFYADLIGTSFDSLTTSEYDNFLGMISNHAPNRENFTRFIAASLTSPEVKDSLAADIKDIAIDTIIELLQKMKDTLTDSIKDIAIDTMVKLLQTMTEGGNEHTFPQAPYEPLDRNTRDIIRRTF